MLSRCKKNICYGKDRVIGDIRYDRRIYHENGFILSSNYDWALIQAKKEAEGLAKPTLPPLAAAEGKKQGGYYSTILQ